MSLNGQPADEVMKTVGTRLRKARKARKMSQTALAKLIGTSPNQISMIENGQSGTSIRTMVAAATVLNVSLDYLAGLHDEPTTPRDLQYALRKSQARVHDLERHGKEPAPADCMRKIPFMAMPVVTEGGIMIHPPGIESSIEFPETWLREQGLQQGNCRMVSIVDESMEPTLADGCAVLVELRSKSPKDRGIYVIRTQHGLVVKRTVLDRKAGWLIVSDNPDKNRFPTQPWGDDAKIMGEVKWHGQSIKVTAEGHASVTAGRADRLRHHGRPGTPSR